jgi:hypothetical protein
MITATEDAWERLGDMLVQRRISLAPRYRVRELFASDVGLKWRLLYDIERHKRQNFTDETLAAFEVAYQLRPGSIATVLDGGQPELMEVPAAPQPEPIPPEIAELLATGGWESMERSPAHIQSLWRLRLAPHSLPAGDIAALIRSYIDQQGWGDSTGSSTRRPA